MLINCAIGEKGAGDKVDDTLMSLIDIATIACGAHAGDAQSIKYYQDLAQQHNVKAAAYLSYPDVDGVDEADRNRVLMDSLEQQARTFGKMQCVKFQGELYKHLNRSVDLAENVVDWLKQMDVDEVIAPYRSMLHKVCSEHKMQVTYEAYADKSYSSMSLGLELMSRDQVGSNIDNVDDICRQVRKMKQGVIEIEGHNYLIEAETLCLDSHSPQAVQNVEAVKKIL